MRRTIDALPLLRRARVIAIPVAKVELTTIQGLTRQSKTDPRCIRTCHRKCADQDQLDAYASDWPSCAAEYRKSYRRSSESTIDAQA
jgi:hypothetical protein